MNLVEPTITKQGNNVYVSHGTDAGLFVTFSIEAMHNEKKSAAEGRPIYEDKEFITIQTPGDTKSIIKRPVRHQPHGSYPSDPDRFPRQWQAFKNQQSQVAVGTPVTEWAMITKSDAMALKALNIHTVEALAEIGENSLTWMGARKLREMAQGWLAQAKDGSTVTKLLSEVEALKRELEGYKNQACGFGVEAPKAPKAKRGGRKKKAD